MASAKDQQRGIAIMAVIGVEKSGVAE